MDGSSLIFIVMPIVIPIFLFGGIAMPLLADGLNCAGSPAAGPHARC